jgi:trehalose 6-phosphate phosphatase
VSGLWPHWGGLARRLLAGRRKLLLLLDFDGTLAPLMPTPSAARMGPEVGRALSALNGHARLSIAVISGRALEDVEKRVGVKTIYYGGNHGLELRGPGIHFQHPQAFLMSPALAAAGREARRIFERVPGAEVEPKGLGVALHDRRVPDSCSELFKRRLQDFKDGAGKQLKWKRGRRVWEGLPPVKWDKGKAADLLFRHVGADAILAVGDDVTDEDMFRAAKGRGASVRVAPEGPSAADYSLPSPAEVRSLLGKLSEELEKRS